MRLECGTRGPVPVPAAMPPIVQRCGLDRSPVDVHDADQRRWLEACVWPDQTDRFDRLRAALELAAGEQIDIRRGDAVADTAPIAASLDAHPVVTNTWVLNYLTAGGAPGLRGVTRRARARSATCRGSSSRCRCWCRSCPSAIPSSRTRCSCSCAGAAGGAASSTSAWHIPTATGSIGSLRHRLTQRHGWSTARVMPMRGVTSDVVGWWRPVIDDGHASRAAHVRAAVGQIDAERLAQLAGPVGERRHPPASPHRHHVDAAQRDAPLVAAQLDRRRPRP